MEEPVLDSADIQGNIAPGFKTPYQYLIGLKGTIEDLQGALVFLYPKLTTMAEVFEYHKERVAKAKATGQFGIASFRLPDHNNFCWYNVALGNDFLKALQINDPDQADTSFSYGLYNQSFLLGDSRDPAAESFHENWVVGSQKSRIDILVIMASDDQNTLSKAVSQFLTKFKAITIYQENGNRLLNETEHFGFRDGVSMPALRGFVYNDNKTFLEARTAINKADTSPEYASPGSILVWPGQYIFGYLQQDNNSYRGSLAGSVNPSTILKNGSFLVFRRLKQDVGAFYKQTSQFATQLVKVPGFEAYDGRKVRSKLIGRWENGSPLSRSPDQAPSRYQPDTANYFMFENDLPGLKLENGKTVPAVKNDMQGLKCPYSAHIRKVNPRDSNNNLGGEIANLTFRPLRRGIPFGPPYDFENEANADNSAERGLIFLAYVTSVNRQFERLQQDWANSTDNPEGNDTGNDMLIGQNNTDNKRWFTFDETNAANTTFNTSGNFVIPTGGDYLFTPSISLVKRLTAVIVPKTP